MSSFFILIWAFIKKWLARFGIAIIFFCLLLASFGIPVNEKFLIGIITVILLGIYEIAFEMNAEKRNLEAEIAKTRKSVGDLRAEIAETRDTLDYLRKRAAPALYSLFQCKQDLEEMLRKARGTETIVVDHLGLDMSQAWEYIHKLLFDKESKPVGVEYRLLILTDNQSSKSSNWPREVADWSQVVPNSLARIQSDMEESFEQFKQGRRRLYFAVRKYDDVPVVHGWSLKRPIRLWHVGHCRWRKNLFDWGPESYVKVDELCGDPVTNEIAKLFDSYFEHLWIVSSPIPSLSFDFDPNKG